MATIRFSAVLTIACLLAGPALAQGPTAIVEDVQGHPAGVEFMDYVEPGRIIRLGPQDSIVLSYLNSCIRETIRGGEIKVGLDHSEAISGAIERVKVDCEAGKMVQAVGQTNDSASLVIRGERTRSFKAAEPPEFTLYGLSPLLELDRDGELVIARLDKKGEYLTFDIATKNLARGQFLDLAREDKSLSAGGVYGVRWGGRLTVFKIDPHAQAGQTPIVGRLLRLVSTN